jgi:tetratricopeptide (TPR) repeat protein
MASSLRRFLDNERYLDFLIRMTLALIFLILLVIVGYRYYFYNVKQVEELPVNKTIKELEAQVRKNPLNINARVQLASAYLAVKRWDDAIRQCLEVLKVDKENQAALTMAAFAYLQKEDYDKALEMCKKEIDTYANAGMALENRYLADAFFYSAVAYWKKGNLDKAIYHANRAALIRRSDADVMFFLGRLYYEKGLHGNAEIYFQKAIRFDPKYLDAHYGLGQVYEKMGLLGMAVNEYERAYNLDQTRKEFREKSDELLEKLEGKAAKNPDFEILVQLGFAYMGRHQWDQAVKTIERAIKLKPDDPLGYYALGYTYERAWANYKDKDELKAANYKTRAMEAYEKCLKLDKDYEGALAGKKRLQLGISEEEVIVRDVKVRK